MEMHRVKVASPTAASAIQATCIDVVGLGVGTCTIKVVDQTAFGSQQGDR